MKNHWNKYLNVKDLVTWLKPGLVVELGAGGGENTEQYLNLQKEMYFVLYVISDENMPERFAGRPLVWINGISYMELPRFKNKTIDFCSIDTDHNYWTLNRELSELNHKMKRGGIVVLHDTESYRHKSGNMLSYNCKVEYPMDEIKKLEFKGLYDAIKEQVEAKEYKILKESKECSGAMALQKI